MMKITVAIQTHNFQHRLAWMLASLAEQTIAKDILVDVASMPNNGNPTTEHTVWLYSNLVSIYHRVYDDIDLFQYRGYTRNDQLAECQTPWLLFSDSDMVYHPRYFEDLLKFVEKQPPNAFFSAGRLSCPPEEADALIAEEQYGVPVENAWVRCHSVLTPIERSNVGAGYSQLINVEHCPHDGHYVPFGKTKDKPWIKGQKARSDQQFRRRIKEKAPHIKLPKEFTLNEFHLNHARDNEVGYHLETQR